MHSATVLDRCKGNLTYYSMFKEVLIFRQKKKRSFDICKSLPLYKNYKLFKIIK